MSGSNKRRRSPRAEGKASAGGSSAGGFAATARGALAGAGTAAAAALVLSLIFAAAALRGGDPARLAPVFGVAARAISSIAAGVVCERVSRASPLVCAALGAGIAAAAMLISLIPALPEAPLPVPKWICAAIPIVCALFGGRLAAPKRGRRHRKR